MAGKIIWGTETIPDVEYVEITKREQQAPPVRTNPETTRNDRQGLRQLAITDMSGGLGIRRGKEASKDITRVRYSDGSWTHISGGAFLPPVVSLQTEADVDISSQRAANRSVIQFNTTIGQTKVRPYYFVPYAYVPTPTLVSSKYTVTSDSDPVLDSGGDFTEKVTAAAEVMLNNTRGILVAFDGTSNDVQLITDPTQNPPTSSTAFALTAGDRIDWIAYKPNLGPGCVLMGGKIGGVKGLFYLFTTEALLTAPHPLVLTSTKDQEGSIATVTTDWVSPGFGGLDLDAGNVGRPSLDNNVDYGQAWWDPWSGPGNILADDGSVATAVVNYDQAGTGQSPLGVVSGKLIAGGFNFSNSVPKASVITGNEVGIKAHESAAADEIFWHSVQLIVNGSEVGIDLCDRSEVVTVADYKVHGSSTIRWGLIRLSGAQVHHGLAYGIQFSGWEGGTASGQVNVGHVRSKLTYRPLGVLAVLPLGGDPVGHHPTKENNFYVLAPEFQDDASARNVPRILWELEFSYDADGERPTVELSKPTTFLSHIESACIAQAAVVVSGANVAGTGKAIRRIRSDGVPEDMQFNTAQGYTESWNIVNLAGNDKAFWALVALDAGTTCQWWLCVNGAWSAYSRRFSTSSLPLRVIGEIDPTQRYAYTFCPSSDDMEVRRQFFALNPLADPLVTNTSIVKENGVLTVQTPELDAGGPEEALKVLLNAWYLGRDVSSTNTVRLRYSIDGGANFTTWTTFTSALSKSALSTPVLFRTLILEIGLDHTAGGTGTPNGLPILIEMTALWKAGRHYRVIFNPSGEVFKRKYRYGTESLWDNLIALQALSPVQTLQTGSGASIKTTWDGDLHTAYNAVSDLTTEKAASALPQTDRNPIHYLEFDEVTV